MNQHPFSLRMKHSFFVCAMLGLLLMAGCQSSSPANQEPENRPIPTDMHAAAKTMEFDVSQLASENDPVCGMPVKAGVADTALYQGKIYGFCNETCKHNFVQSPADYLSAK
jgi:YHS domain-containing protein